MKLAIKNLLKNFLSTKVDWRLMQMNVTLLVAFCIYFAVGQAGSLMAAVYGVTPEHNVIYAFWLLGGMGGAFIFWFFIYRPIRARAAVTEELLCRSVRFNEQLITELEKKRNRIDGDEWKDS